jgi:hypothetical protein
MYRDDDVARTERASSLIDEIADLERKKVEHAAAERRLEDARRELTELQAPAPQKPEKRPGVVVHALVFGATAACAYLGYTLLV